VAYVPFQRVPSQMNAEAYQGSRNCNEALCLVVNPRAAAGRAGARLDDLRRAAGRAFESWELRLTEGPGHAALLAEEAVEQGFGIVAAVGGDGTCHEVVQGMVVGLRPRSNRCVFTTIPFGTGSDLVRSISVPRRLNEALWMAATGITLPTDVGRATWLGEGATGEDGVLREELFINVAGFGANGDVVCRANAMDKRLGGRATFLLAGLRTASRYAAVPLGLRWTAPDGSSQVLEAPLLSGFVANGAFCGGGMRVGGHGTMHDGLLDVTTLPPGPLSQRLLDARHLYDGHIDRIRGARCFQASTLEVTVLEPQPLPVDLDGEERTGGTVRFEVLPAALQVRGGWIRNPVRGDRGRQLR